MSVAKNNCRFYAPGPDGVPWNVSGTVPVRVRTNTIHRVSGRESVDRFVQTGYIVIGDGTRSYDQMHVFRRALVRFVGTPDTAGACSTWLFVGPLLRMLNAG